MRKNLLSTKQLPQFIIVILVLLFLAWGFFGEKALDVLPIKSVEVGVTSLSPKGLLGGLAIPASCPSYEHSPGECAPPSPSLSGNGSGATTINSGGSVLLEWNASGANSCDGFNFATGGATSGSEVATPALNTTYTIICYYPPSYSPTTAQSSVGVTVLHPALGISASPTSVRSGNQSTITWSATNVDSCLVTGPNGFSQTGIFGSAPSGSLTQQSVFVITCENEGGEISDSVTVTIIPEFEEI